MNKLTEIVTSIAPELGEFENKLKNIVKDENFLKDYLVDFLFSNPKRLRPILIYLFAKVLNINSKEVDYIALSTELIHSASLIHDDIIDEAKLRRNKQSFYDKFGSKKAVLEGDYLLSLSLVTLSKVNIDTVKIFSKKIKETILGELNQNSNLNKIQSVEEYITKTLAKTTSLFVAGVESLFSLKEVDKTTKKAILDFMKNYSIAFQIKNDIDNILKENASDLKFGNYTLPVIYFCLDKNVEQVDVKQFNLEKEKYILKSSETMENYKNLAIKVIENIEASIYKKEIIELCEYSLRS